MQARRDCELFLFQEKMPKSGVRNFSAGTSRRLVLCHEKGCLNLKGFSAAAQQGAGPPCRLPSRCWQCQHLLRDEHLPPAAVLGQHFPLELLIPQGFAAPWSRLRLRAGLAASVAPGRPLLEIFAPAKLCWGWHEGLFCLGSCPQHHAGFCTGDA